MATKVISVTSMSTERNAVTLADKIEKSVTDFIESQPGAQLDDFSVAGAQLAGGGHGSALVVIKFTEGGKKSKGGDRK